MKEVIMSQNIALSYHTILKILLICYTILFLRQLAHDELFDTSRVVTVLVRAMQALKKINQLSNCKLNFLSRSKFDQNLTNNQQFIIKQQFHTKHTPPTHPLTPSTQKILFSIFYKHHVFFYQVSIIAPSQVDGWTTALDPQSWG